MSHISSNDLSPAALQSLLATADAPQLIDVREAFEFAGGRIAGARLIPLGEIAKRTAEIDAARPVILICESGKRSNLAREKLTELGFKNIACATGGFVAWKNANLPFEKDAYAPWSIERQVKIVAGSLVLTGLSLGWFVHPGFLGLSAFVGCGLVFAGVSDFCGMAILLGKAPWNQRRV